MQHRQAVEYSFRDFHYSLAVVYRLTHCQSMSNILAVEQSLTVGHRLGLKNPLEAPLKDPFALETPIPLENSPSRQDSIPCLDQRSEWSAENKENQLVKH